MKPDSDQLNGKDSASDGDRGDSMSQAAVSTVESGESQSYSQVWQGLMAGDPGPYVAMFDSLLNGDFPFAAGGLLRDLAERIIDADDFVECDDERKLFVETATQALLTCEQGDETALKQLLAEAEAD